MLKLLAPNRQMSRRAAMVQIPYSVGGDVVRVKEGTFAGMSGEVEEINEAKAWCVVITVFGRQTPVELEVWQVEEEVN